MTCIPQNFDLGLFSGCILSGLQLFFLSLSCLFWQRILTPRWCTQGRVHCLRTPWWCTQGRIQCLCTPWRCTQDRIQCLSIAKWCTQGRVHCLYTPKEKSITCEHHSVVSKGEFISYMHFSTQWCTSQWCTQSRLHLLSTPGYSVPLEEFIYYVHHSGVFKVEFFACIHHNLFPVMVYPRVFSCVACTTLVSNNHFVLF